MARSRDTFAPEPVQPRARSDAYTGLLFVSLVAMIIGCALLYLDLEQYGSNKPPAVPTATPQAAPDPQNQGGAPMMPANMP